MVRRAPSAPPLFFEDHLAGKRQTVKMAHPKPEQPDAKRGESQGHPEARPETMVAKDQHGPGDQTKPPRHAEDAAGDEELDHQG